MKILTKIAILTAFTALVSSCQKENLPVPGNCSAKQEDAANLRITDSVKTGISTSPLIINEEKNRLPDEVVGGGDDDRDGGDGKKGKRVR
jgi:hypothetical protein